MICYTYIKLGGVIVGGKISETKTRTLITLEKDFKEELERCARLENRSLSNYIVNILKEKHNATNKKD